MCLVSIVVPAYKVEKYLDRCVKSLINQTLKDIEIILVDDGSPDKCPIICDEWAKRDRRIKVIHKKNGGLSSARNAGLAIVSGKYVGFVDSDDDIEDDMFEQMFAVAEKENVDFVMEDYYRITANGSLHMETVDIDEGRYDKQKIVDKIFPNLIMKETIDYGPLLSVCHCLYSTEFIKKNNIRFDEEVKWSEDNIFSSIVGYKANSFFYMKGKAGYHYYQNEGSITTSYRKNAWYVYCVMNEHLHAFFDDIIDYDFSRQLKLHLIYYACNCINMECLREKNEAIAEIRNILKDEQLREAFRSAKPPKCSLKLKLQLALMKLQCAKIIYYLKKQG